MELQLPKGTRDFSPQEKIMRDKIVATLKEVFELYGFAPLETPILERYEVLSSKYAGGAEILKETFKLKDQGDRELGMRYDLTVPLARFVGMNPWLKMPFKRYQIGEVFRDGPIAMGRYRQFSQCDIDVIGSASLATDAELLSMIYLALSKLGFKSTIKINSRKLLNDVLDYCGITKKKQENAILSIDKIEKFGIGLVKEELMKQKIDEDKIGKIVNIMSIKGTNENKIAQLKNLLKKSDGLDEIIAILDCMKNYNVDVDFDVSLARGLSYYTGTVMETFLADSDVKSAVCSGGRYDSMIGSFLGKERVPAVGISFGLDRLYDAMLEKQKSFEKTTARIFVIPIKTINESIKIANRLRIDGINADLDLNDKGISKNLEYANSLGIPYVLFVGKKELSEGKVKLRDMKTGKQLMVKVEEVRENID